MSSNSGSNRYVQIPHAEQRHEEAIDPNRADEIERNMADITDQGDDHGMRRGQRRWELRNGAHVAPAGEVIRTNGEVLTLEIRLADMDPTGTTFGSFSPDLPTAVILESLFHLVIEASAQLKSDLEVPDQANQLQGAGGFPFYVRLETLFQDPLYQAQAGSNDKVRSDLVEYMTKLFQDSELFVKSARADAGVDEALENARFMSGMRDRVVIGWRFWFYSLEPSKLLSDSITVELRKIFKYYKAQNDQTQPAADNQTFQRRANIVGDDGVHRAASMTTTYTRQWSISSPSVLCEVVSIYTRDETLTAQSLGNRVVEVMDPRNPYDSPRSELHPRNFLSVKKLFLRVSRDKQLDARQRNIAYYIDGNLRNEMRFRDEQRRQRALEAAFANAGWIQPYSSSVVVVPAHYLSVHILANMYQPSHQWREVEPLYSVTRKQMMRMASEQNNGDDAAIDVARRAEQDDAEVSEVIFNQHSIEQDDAPGARVPGIDGQPMPPVERLHDDNDNDNDQPQIPRGALNIDGLYDDERARLARAAANMNDDERVQFARRMAAESRVREISATKLDFSDAGKYKDRLIRDMGNTAAQRYETHRMAASNAAQMEIIKQIVDRKQRARARAQMQIAGIDAYATRCMTEHSDVSNAGRALNAEYVSRLKKDDLRFVEDYSYFDTELSLVGTFLARQFLVVYETVLGAVTGHVECHFVLIASLCAYYHVMGLRFLLLLFGLPGVGKSFAIGAVIRLLVETSVTVITNESRLAGNTDENENDMIINYHEIPSNKISGGSGEQNSGSGNNRNKPAKPSADSRDNPCDQLKNEITEGVTSRHVLDIKSGSAKNTRRNRPVVTERQKSVIGATNMFGAHMSPAIVDRGIVIHSMEKARADGDDVNTKKTHAGSDNMRYTTLVRITRADHQLMQIIVYHTEKLIMVNLLHQPTLTVYNYIWPIYKRTLSERFSIALNNRHGDKMHNVVRVHVVWLGVFWLYNAPTSPFYKRPFNIYHLPALEPMLKDSIEIVLFCLDLMRDQFIDPLQVASFNLLRSKFVPAELKFHHAKAQKAAGAPADDYTLELDCFSSAFCSKTTGKRNQAQISNAAMSIQQSTKTRLVEAPTTAAPLPPLGITMSAVAAAGQQQRRNAEYDAVLQKSNGGSGASTTTTAVSTAANGGGGGRFNNRSTTARQSYTKTFYESQEPETFDYDYMQFPYPKKVFAEHIAKQMETLPNGRKPAAADVEKMIDTLNNAKNTIKSRPYKPNPANDPKVPVVPDYDKPMTIFKVFKFYSYEKIGIHVSMLFGEFPDAHETAVNSCITMFSETMTCIMGRPQHEELPNVLGVRRIRPGKGTINARINAPISRAQRSGGGGGADENGDIPFVLLSSVDEEATIQRCEKLALPRDPVTVKKFVPAIDDALCREKLANNGHPLMKYPEFAVEEARQRLKERRLNETVLPQMTMRDIEHRAATGEIRTSDVIPITDEYRNRADLTLDDRKIIEALDRREASIRNAPQNQSFGLDNKRTLASYVPSLTVERDGILGEDQNKAAQVSAPDKPHNDNNKNTNVNMDIDIDDDEPPVRHVPCDYSANPFDSSLPPHRTRPATTAVLSSVPKRKTVNQYALVEASYNGSGEAELDNEEGEAELENVEDDGEIVHRDSPQTQTALRRAQSWREALTRAREKYSSRSHFSASPATPAVPDDDDGVASTDEDDSEDNHEAIFQYMQQSTKKAANNNRQEDEDEDDAAEDEDNDVDDDGVAENEVEDNGGDENNSSIVEDDDDAVEEDEDDAVEEDIDGDDDEDEN